MATVRNRVDSNRKILSPLEIRSFRHKTQINQRQLIRGTQKQES